MRNQDSGDQKYAWRFSITCKAAIRLFSVCTLASSGVFLSPIRDDEIRVSSWSSNGIFWEKAPVRIIGHGSRPFLIDNDSACKILEKLYAERGSSCLKVYLVDGFIRCVTANSSCYFEEVKCHRPDIWGIIRGSRCNGSVIVSRKKLLKALDEPWQRLRVVPDNTGISVESSIGEGSASVIPRIDISGYAPYFIINRLLLLRFVKRLTGEFIRIMIHGPGAFACLISDETDKTLAFIACNLEEHKGVTS